VTDDFTVVLLPDTQNMVAAYPSVWAAIPAWIAANIGAQNIKAVISLGDVVNQTTATQLATAKAGWDTLMATGLPCFLGVGNHDYDDPSMGAARAFTAFPVAFPVSYVSGQPTYGGAYAGTVENWWGTFRAGSGTYLVLMLEPFPRPAVLAWAQTVLDARAGIPTILMTHSHLSLTGERTRARDIFGAASYIGANGLDADAVWTTFIKPNPQIFLVCGGHQLPTPTAVYTPDVNAAGRLVHQLMLNHQADANGGNGYIGLLRFRPSLGLIELTGYSVTLDVTDPSNSFAFPMPGATSGASGSVVGDIVRAASRLVVAGWSRLSGKVVIGTQPDNTASAAQLQVVADDGYSHARFGNRFGITGAVNCWFTNGASFRPGTGWVYAVTGSAVSGMQMGADGAVSFHTAPPGVAGAALVWTETLRADAGGAHASAFISP